jgi:hypothetical protein
MVKNNRRKRLLRPPKLPSPKSMELDLEAAQRFRELADRLAERLAENRPTPRLRKG